LILVLAVVLSIIVSTVGRAGGLWFESRRWHVWILQPYLTFRVVYNMCVYKLYMIHSHQTWFFVRSFSKNNFNLNFNQDFFPFLIDCFDLSWCLFIDLMLNVYLFNNFCERMMKIRKKCDLCTKTNQSKLWYV